MKNQTAQTGKEGKREMTAGQMKDISSALIQTIPSDLSFDAAEQIIKAKSVLSWRVKKFFLFITSNPYAELLLDWEHFYHKYFQRTYDFSSLVVPICPGDGWRLLIIADFKLEQLYGKCKELFPCETDEDLNDVIQTISQAYQDSKDGPYAIWVKSSAEADNDLDGLSADDIDVKDIDTETLAERLVHEIKFFAETNEHLDAGFYTLCSGSEYVSGLTPCVYWSGKKLVISSFEPDVGSRGYRHRQVFRD